MKLSKFLLISSVSALILGINILPVVAKPSVELYQVKHVQPEPSLTAISLRSSLYDQVNGYNNLPSISNLTNNFNNSFSSTLILKVQPMFQENSQNSEIGNGSHSHTFLETTMIFNDKLQQFLSLFNDNKANQHLQEKGCESK